MDIGKTKRITNVPEPIIAPVIKTSVPEPERERELVPVRRREVVTRRI